MARENVIIKDLKAARDRGEPKTQFNVRIPAARAQWVRILAATRGGGCQPSDIVEEALALLAKKEARK